MNKFAAAAEGRQKSDGHDVRGLTRVPLSPGESALKIAKPHVSVRTPYAEAAPAVAAPSLYEHRAQRLRNADRRRAMLADTDYLTTAIDTARLQNR